MHTEHSSEPRTIVTTSWDDGHPMDLKLADLLSEFGIQATFYVAPYNRERAVLAASDLRALSEHFEIGAHTMTHPDLTRLYARDLKNEIGGSKSELEGVIGAPLRMFCYPKGRHNRRVRNAVMNAGFLGARTMREFFLNPGRDVWQMATTISVFPLPSWIRFRHELRTVNWRGLRALWRSGIGTSWVELACGLFEEVLEHGGVWHFWGHSWEIEEYDLWDSLRTVLSAVAHREGVSYLTNSHLVKNSGYFLTKE